MENTAHELRNFLTVIYGYCDLGTSSKKPPDYCFEMIRNAARNCSEIVDQIFEPGRLAARAGPLDVNAIVYEVARSVRGLLPREIELLEELDPALPVVCNGNSFDLYRALLNLCQNASKAMRNGGTLRIATSSDNGLVFLSVSDTGCGMDRALIERVMGPHLSECGEHGRGLSIVKDTATALGGHLTVRSEVGIGTTFVISLPMASSE